MNPRRAVLVTAAAAALALALPAGANAMTAGVNKGFLRVNGEAGEVNSCTIEAAANKRVRFVQVFDVEPGPTCRPAPDLHCNAENGILVNLADGPTSSTCAPGCPPTR